MRSYIITTDNTCDLPDEYYREHDIEYQFLPYVQEGIRYTKENEMPLASFYDKMREGSTPTTTQYNSDEITETWRPYIAMGMNVLHIAFSSGLSGSYNSARLAAEEINEEAGETRVVVVDSLCASMGEGLLLWHAVRLKEEGRTLEEVAGWLEKYKLNMCHVFTVDHLKYLYRGGRVSRTKAVLGTVAGIKPLLHVDNEGKLIPLTNIRGRKKSLLKLVDMMEERIGSFRSKTQIVMISHGDCIDDALFVRDEVKKRFGYENFMINNIGATIGAHAGPGTLALFFAGEHR